MPFSLGFTKAKSYGTIPTSPGKVIWSIPRSPIIIKKDQARTDVEQAVPRDEINPLRHKACALASLYILWFLPLLVAGLLLFMVLCHPTTDVFPPHRSCDFQAQFGFSCIGDAEGGIETLQCSNQMLQRLPGVPDHLGRSAWINPLNVTVFGCQAVDGAEMLVNDSIWKCQEAECEAQGLNWCEKIQGICADGSEE